MGYNGAMKAKRPAPPSPTDVRERLASALPEPRCELDHADAWQLLVATILSAQSTDRRVNQVTPVLFDRWPTPAELAAAALSEVEQVVHSTGFFRRKAKSIQAAARLITDTHGGVVPPDMDALLALPGVARKTANLVLGTAFGVASGMIIDTHAARVGQRLGLTTASKAEKIERDLCAAWPPEDWIAMSHRLILHGRYICRSRSPECGGCPLNEICPSRESAAEGSWQQRARAEGQRVAARSAQ